MDVERCLRQGVVGAVGAVPGTIAAHPFDVVKIFVQTSAYRGTSSSFVGYFRSVHLSGGLPGFYRGLTPAVGQKILTRGPMFLLSEAATQAFMTLGCDRKTATFVGSAVSGYCTGSIAALAEWKKVMHSQKITGAGNLVKEARRAGQTKSVWRRINGAGTRNAIFDATFFGSSYLLTTEFGCSPGLSYAISASFAVALDYPVDVAVKRMMVAPPTAAVPRLFSLTRDIFRNGGASAVYRGLNVKGVEFFISYLVTGSMSPFVLLFLSTQAVSLSGKLKGDPP